MKVWILNGRAVFAPRAGAIPVDPARVVEEDTRTVGATEERGAVDSVDVNPDGTVRIRYKPKPIGKLRAAERSAAGANSVAKLKDLVIEILALLKSR